MAAPKHRVKGSRVPRASASVCLRMADGSVQRVKHSEALSLVTAGAKYISRTAWKKVARA